MRIFHASLLAAALCIVPAFAADPPQAQISNGQVKATIYLPDAKNGFYKGERFEWAGIVGSLEYAGHNYYGPWFDSVDPTVRDFVFKDGKIVASDASGISGPAEEFRRGIGYDEAQPGGLFLKLGVGVLRKADATAYSNYAHYEMVDGGKWSVKSTPNSVEITQTLDNPESGFGYVYTKRLSLTAGKPQLVIEHSLKNTGKRSLTTNLYDHNFFVLDGKQTGPDISVRVPYELKPVRAPDPNAITAAGNEIHYVKAVEGEARVSTGMDGFGTQVSDYDFRVENKAAGAGLRITSDRPVKQASLWSIRRVMAVEPTIDIPAEPGQTFTWRYTYDYYTLGK